MSENYRSGLCKLVFLLMLLSGIWSCDSDTGDPPIVIPPPNLTQWSGQPTFTAKSLTDVHFVNRTFGWAVGQRLVLATSNGGNSWPEAPLNESKLPNTINSVQFISEQKGWMAGGMVEDEIGEVFISEQGGAYPSLQESSSSLLNTVFFINEQKGWAAGSLGDIISTEDGGLTWNVLATLGTEITDIQFTTNNKGWAVSTDGSLHQTTDGVNFQVQDIGISNRLNGIHFTDTLRGWLCGTRNTIYKRHVSADNKIVWSETSFSDSATDIDWNDIYFVNATTGWVVGSEGNIYKTADAGVTWIRETSGTFENLNAIHMISSSKGWIAGDNGLILTYTP